MKPLKLIALSILLLMSIKSFSQDSTASSKIYFIRNTGYNGSAINFHCFADSQLVCNIKNKKFSVHNIDTGSHVFNVRSSGKEITSSTNALTIHIEAGKSYYIKILPGQSYSLASTLKLLEVSESIAQSLLPKCTQQTDCLK